MVCRRLVVTAGLALLAVSMVPEPAGAGRITSNGIYALELAYPAAGTTAKLVEVRTGAKVEAGDAVAVSGNGRVLFGPGGKRTDRISGTVTQPDLSAFAGVTAVRFDDAADDGSVYLLQLFRGAQDTVPVLVDAGGVATAAPGLVDLSPNGRYLAYTDRIVERSDGRSVASAATSEQFYLVADDGSHLVGDVAGGSAGRIVGLDGSVRLTVPSFVDGSYQSYADDLTVALLLSPNGGGRLSDVWAVDLASGARVRLATAVSRISPTAFETWMLAGDGDTAAMLSGGCDLSFTYCTYGAVTPHPGLRARLAAVAVVEPLRRLGAGGVGTLPLTGVAGVPRGARAVLANLTATETAGPGYLTAWACGGDRPRTSNLNYGAGGTAANALVAPLDDSGRTCLYSLQGADIVVDVAGWLDEGFQPRGPTRLLDTRPGPAAAGDRLVRVPGLGYPFLGPQTAVLNVTATEAVSDGFVTVWPCAEPRPLASNLNVEAGGTRANLVVAPLPSDGALCLYSNVAMHLVVDYEGSFADEQSSVRTPIVSFAPRRLLDTRSAGAGGLAAGTVTTVPIVLPDGRTARPGDTAVLNLTATGSTAPGFVTAFPCGEPRPRTSNLNHATGQTIANTVFAPVGAGGAVCLYNQSPGELVVDLDAWSDGADPSSAFHAVTPTRLVDTRG